MSHPKEFIRPGTVLKLENRQTKKQSMVPASCECKTFYLVTGSNSRTVIIISEHMHCINLNEHDCHCFTWVKLFMWRPSKTEFRASSQSFPISSLGRSTDYWALHAYHGFQTIFQGSCFSCNPNIVVDWSRMRERGGDHGSEQWPAELGKAKNTPCW